MASLIPGQLTPIGDHAWRVLARNPGMMTGPGTNSYLFGKDSLTVIDPGPEDQEHLQALLQAARTLGKPIDQVVVTHTHRDHSPGALALVAATGARCLGPSVPDDGLQDESWQADRLLAEGDRVDCGGVSLQVIETPGHVGNHLCYLSDDGMLFTGDHLIQGSTVVIAPPSGSMQAYFASLRKLQQRGITRMAPGHGDLISDPEETLTHTLAHRQKREDKVLDALLGDPQTLAVLVKVVYDDVPEFLHGVAQFSLQAHLIKLAEDGKAEETDQGWHKT
ncbi:MAG TPA: MBL fold metallo-hydrolase [Alcanivorax sp.]|jgi:hydroxyacylglutathione hydrolase|uniref:MBL fold metallo-hydrolase n=1 Tax=Alcanivorax TaxID=59753 RepID=UPI000C8ADFB4|nr:MULTISPECIES: MBL fold metallo-hydrolase [Alcanivorax]MAC16230.1 MBL fold metallo-hydrolase [Alcanivorax sp.]MDF1638578.1 MBL fold metallo-hydrolase [Alcanivorax jadensis]HBC17799.1 MBL fold metallo-hydrolase [Alcanivorax sp.]|tara:strand:- start:2131 stop:2964 length:834 start_codon:yes stop_codon:yes gene_type:complete